MFKPAISAPKDGRKFWAYWLGVDNGRRLIKWNATAIPALIDAEHNITVEAALAVGWIPQDEPEITGNVDGFAFWAPEDGLSYRQPVPTANPFVSSPDQAVLARLAYKAQEAGYQGSRIFECLIPNGDTIDMEATLDKIVGYLTGNPALPKLTGDPLERF